MRRISHLLGHAALVRPASVHRLLLSATAFAGKQQLWPVDAVGEHEVLAMNLTALLQVVARVQNLIGALVEGNHGDGDPVVGLGGSVVDNPQADVGWGRVWVGRSGWDEAEAPPRVECELLAGEIASLVEVDLENLLFVDLVSFHAPRRLARLRVIITNQAVAHVLSVELLRLRPDESIARKGRAEALQRLPCEDHGAIGRLVEIGPEERGPVLCDLRSAHQELGRLGRIESRGDRVSERGYQVDVRKLQKN
jgi:hypothetical protein